VAQEDIDATERHLRQRIRQQLLDVNNNMQSLCLQFDEVVIALNALSHTASGVAGVLRRDMPLRTEAGLLADRAGVLKHAMVEWRDRARELRDKISAGTILPAATGEHTMNVQFRLTDFDHENVVKLFGLGNHSITFTTENAQVVPIPKGEEPSTGEE
jgi:hypothetical protein